MVSAPKSTSNSSRSISSSSSTSRKTSISTPTSLASRLVGVEIDVFREVEEEDDIDLDEFEVDFGAETIQLLRDIGCDSARAVLELDEEELIRRTDGKIDREEAERIIDIIAYEFEDEED